jgi:serine/threonine protein kinase
MTPERYAHVCQLFDEAGKLTPGERDTFLDRTCGADTSLRAEVEKLLRHDRPGQGTPLLPSCLPNVRSLLPAAAPEDSLTGRRIGPYEVRERVGSGGMGSVYRAVRVDDYQQQVAIKLIKLGLDDPELLERFRTERQVLAGLNHPHIARLLDGGTTADGQPYLVMEFIEGRPLDAYCDGRQLTSRQRAELLRAVCAAVQHAHEHHQVVHRDLKPGNVLVTADGTPKVTDFGLAKRLDGDGLQTASGVILGTPSYMAPEQAAGKTKEVGPAADVYALGAILYDLLTGRPPFKADTPLDTVLQVLTEEPVPPRRLQPRLPADLETICLKCLEKEPGRRYAGARELADDLGRFLAGEPVRARPSSLWRRGLKWVKRRPLAAALLGVSALAAAALLAVSGLYNARLTRERDRALELEAEARRQRDDAQEQKRQAQRNLELAVGAIAGLNNLGNATLYQGRFAEVEAAYRRVEAMYRRLADDHPDDREFRRGLAASYNNLGSLYKAWGRPRESLDSHQKALEIRQQLAAARPGDPRAENDLGVSYLNLGQLYDNAQRYEDALKAYGKSVEVLDRVVRDHPAVADYRANLARARLFLGDLHAAQGRADKAESELGQALDLYGRLNREHPGSTDYALGLAMAYSNKGRLLTYLKGRPEEALPWYGRAVAALDKILRAEPDHADARAVLSATLLHRGEAGTRLERHAEALKDWERLIGLERDETKRARYRIYRAVALAWVGDYRQALAEADALARGPAQQGDDLYDLACVYSLASAAIRRDDRLAQEERDKGAEQHAARAVRLLRASRAKGYFNAPETVQSMKQDKCLEPLRSREDYRRLLNELGQARP